MGGFVWLVDSVARPDKHPSSPLAGVGGLINGVFCAVLLGVAALLMGPLVSLTFVGLMRKCGLSWMARTVIDILVVAVGTSMENIFGAFLIFLGLSALLEGAVLNLFFGSVST